MEAEEDETSVFLSVDVLDISDLNNLPTILVIVDSLSAFLQVR
jgi:hypothetical protein